MIVSSPVPRFAIRFSSSRSLSRCSATCVKRAEHSYITGTAAAHLSAFCRHWASRCGTKHQPQKPQSVTLVALPYLSLICNTQGTPGSPATTCCRSSSPHTGRSGSPQSPPCTRSAHPHGTAGHVSPLGHSRMLQRSQTLVRAKGTHKHPETAARSLPKKQRTHQPMAEPCSHQSAATHSKALARP